MASKNTIGDGINKGETGAQKKVKIAATSAPSQTTDSIKVPACKVDYVKFTKLISSINIDETIENNFVKDELCSVSSLRTRIQKKINRIEKAAPRDEISHEEQKMSMKNIEDVPLILHKHKSKKIIESADSSTSNEILSSYNGIQIKQAEQYFNEFNTNKKKMYDLLSETKLSDTQFDLYYEHAKKLQKILNDFENIVHKDDYTTNKECDAFTSQQEEIIECIANAIEQFYFIEEYHSKSLKFNKCNESNYCKEFEQLTDIITDLLQDLS